MNFSENLWNETDQANLIIMVEKDKLKWKEIARKLNRSYNAVYKKYYKIKKAQSTT